MKCLASRLSAYWLLLAAPFPVSAKDTNSELAGKAQAILKTNCYRCHGQEGMAKGGFSSILDRDKLIAQNKVVPGKASESLIYQRVLKGEMPPQGQKVRPSKDDLAVLQQWIDAGAPGFATTASARPFLSDNAVLRLMLDDLQTVEPRHRRFMRYFTLAPLYNAGHAEEDLQAARQALAKLINSLSWHPRISVPRPVDTAKTVYRIDLRDYKWNARAWERVATLYPYRIAGTGSEAKACAAATGTELPVVRADWFVATASRPPLYHDLLQLPATDRALERLLQVDVPANLQEETAARAGFNNSGVSKNNRLIERHDASYGAYWRSYDFAENSGRQNLFEHPLGPQTGQTSFEHAGGEIIFNLPNGLQGYLLVDRNGRRIDKAPIEIVSDPKRPDRIVETGLSCMSCHIRGILPKADQVRAHVEKNPNAFSKSDIEAIKALYLPEAKMTALMEEDAQRFLKALAKTGSRETDTEPVVAVTLRYEDVLDLPRAAAELGLSQQEFLKRLGRSATLSRILGPLNTKGGTVQRQVFLDSFPEIVRAFRLVEDPPESGTAPSVGSLTPFEGHTGYILCVAFSPDGKKALSGSEDRTIRLWDVATAKELRRFEGHTDEVLAVAFSPDGRRFVSGGRDRTVRLWEVESGKELRRFSGHTDKVRAVAFAPDGRRLLSAGDDRALRLWDASSGEELQRLAGHKGPVNSVAFSPDGRHALSGSHDQTMRLWDVAKGQEVRRFEGHTREVYSVTFSSDGRKVLSGGNDKTVRLWEVETGKELRLFKGHANAVIGVAFGREGNEVLAGSSKYDGDDHVIRRWDAESGRKGDSHGSGDRVWCIAFSPDGRRALSGNSDKNLRLWILEK